MDEPCYPKMTVEKETLEDNTEEEESKMNKIYEVLHYYDVDGEYGDAVPENNVIAIFTEREKAKRFVEKYSKPHAYAKPYSYLYCGYLTINEREVNKEPDESEMWWLHNCVVEVTDDDEDDED